MISSAEYICPVITFKHFIKVFLTVCVHIVLWTLYIALPHYLYDLPVHHFNYDFRLIEILLEVSIFYCTYFILVPKLMMRRRFWTFGIIVACCLVLTNIVARQAEQYFPVHEQYVVTMEQLMPQGGNIRMEHRIQQIGTSDKFMPNRPRMITFSMLLIFAISTSASLAVHYYGQERLRKDAERAKLSGELQFLKSQINPHFLFNVLNNMYGLALKKSDLLPDSILKLSDMMRYMLYDSEDKQVPLKSEITYLENYIDLQKLRLANRIDISFVKEGEVGNKLISPMILIPFVENIFKHGITHNGNSYIFIYMKIDGDTLIFKTDNPFTGHKAKDKASGIGVQNVQRRLELLYPNRHSLMTEVTGGRYIATLVLQLHGLSPVTPERGLG